MPKKLDKLIDQYNSILKNHFDNSYDEIGKLLQEKIIRIWIDEYKVQCNRATDIGSMFNGSFEYIYDDCESLVKKGILPSENTESRMVAATGISFPKLTKRDDYRLKGWLGKTETVFGKEWDKGHFIAHSIGGAIDSMEVNVYPQKRALNRGWSDEGKIFRKMESYCFKNQGTYCYTRPIYLEHTSRPDFIEFFILMHNKTIWSEIFDNR